MKKLKVALVKVRGSAKFDPYESALNFEPWNVEPNLFIYRRCSLPVADIDDDVLRTDEFVFVISRARD